VYRAPHRGNRPASGASEAKHILLTKTRRFALLTKTRRFALLTKTRRFALPVVNYLTLT